MPPMPPLRHLCWIVAFMVSISAAVVVRPFMMDPIYSSSFPSGEIDSAALALRRNGYTSVAATMDVYPDIFFLSPSSYLYNQFTVFAVSDDYIRNCSLPSSTWKTMLQYHTILDHLPFDVLLGKSNNSCLTTVAIQQATVTTSNFNERRVEVNTIPIAHPDLFLGKNIVIHGVLAPFSNPQCGYMRSQGKIWLVRPFCSYSESNLFESHLIEIISILRQNGFEKYAEELNDTIASIVLGHGPIKSATIFAPYDLAADIYPADLFTMIVMRQIILGRYYHSDLLSLPDGTRLATMTGEQVLVRVNYSQFSIGKTILMKPDLGSNAAFVVHGINTGFTLEDHGLP